MTPYTLSLVTAPAIEPVTLAQAKAHLRVDISDDDAYITSLISVARLYAERHTKKAIVTQTWDMFFDQFHYFDTRELTLPYPPVQSVTWLKYVATDQTVAPFTYTALTENQDYIVDVNRKPARIYPAFAKYWPASLPIQNAVNIRFVAGYTSATASVAYAALVAAQAGYALDGSNANAQTLAAALATYTSAQAAAIPQTLIQAVLLMVSHWYENRESVIAERGVVPAEVPFTVDALLNTETLVEFP